MAQQLRELGFNAVSLEGGFAAWRDKFPVEHLVTSNEAFDDEEAAAY